MVNNSIPNTKVDKEKSHLRALGDLNRNDGKLLLCSLLLSQYKYSRLFHVASCMWSSTCLNNVIVVL